MNRYLILILLNLPVFLLALINAITKYKLGRVDSRRLKMQLLIWIIIMLVVIGAFPVYNYLSGRQIFDASELSSFDIVQSTVIIWLLYAINSQRQKLERVEKTIRELHQDLSIKLSDKK